MNNKIIEWDEKFEYKSKKQIDGSAANTSSIGRLDSRKKKSERECYYAGHGIIVYESLININENWDCNRRLC